MIAYRKVSMCAEKMHADEADIDESLVRRMLATQFPQWADLPVTPIDSAGTDNAMYRLGEDMAVRLPRVPRATGQVDKEQRWLPWLAPHLSLAIPVPLAMGEPGDGYPWRWSIYRWLEGETPTMDRIAAPREAATALAGFVTDLWRIDPTDGPAPGDHNVGRGSPLATRDTGTRAAIAALHDTLDTDAVTAAWEAALRAPTWDGPPVWLHGDLIATNLLAVDGRLSAVIDFGCLGIGDPACDVMPAWTFFTGQTRQAFREALQVDDPTWERGSGWALSFGLVALPYYQTTNPVLAGIARHAIDEVLADHRNGHIPYA
jgi:aminoglycoside phosphotransferase (APT) family kinase protein